MKQINNQISISELNDMSKKMYEGIVKAVVDIEKKLVVVDAEFHADIERELLKNGSTQQNLWGINLHPELYGTEDFIEFDSMINIRPNQDNPSRDVLNRDIRENIISIVKPRIHE